jgi:hypothetical protein
VRWLRASIPFTSRVWPGFEPDDRLVVLARTIQARDLGTETALKDSAVNWARFGETCLGQALYRHRSVFRNAAEAPVWSHFELSYFRNIVSADAIHDTSWSSANRRRRTCCARRFF